MRKQMRQYLKRSLCGVLSAAMILTGSSLSAITAYAAPTDVENEGGGLTDPVDNDTDLAAPVENEDAVPEPDAGEDMALPDDGEIVAIKNGTNIMPASNDDGQETTTEKTYTDQSVTLNYYVGDLAEDETVGLYKWVGENSSITVDETKNPVLSWKAWNSDANAVYQMNAVDGHDGWYNITFTVTGTAGKFSFSVFRSTQTSDAHIKCEENTNQDIYYGLLDGTITAVKEYKGYATIDAADGSEESGDSKEALTELVNKAKELKQSDYEAESWTAFSTALTAAEEVLAKDSPTSDEIETACSNLQSAMDALVVEAVTLYYYVGETEDEIGLYHWADGEADNNLTSTAANASWKVWNDNDTYLMTAVENCAGWYSIPLKFQNNGENVGFQIFTQTVAESSDKDGNYLFKCDGTDYKNIYAELTSGNNKAVAVKDKTGYVNDGTSDILKDVTRHVTLHVYDDAGVPSIAVKEGGLSYFKSNTETGIMELTPCEVSKDESWAKRYDFTADSEGSKWYNLTFVVPEQFVSGGKTENVQLWTKAGDTYTWVKNFTDGTGDDDTVNCSPVFEGKVYYKDGTFYESQQEAEGISLKQLKDLIASEQVKKIVDNGKDYYTEETWTAFDTAKKQADKAVSDNSAQGDSYIGEDIKAAYIALEAAVKNMVPVVSESATLYFYTDELKKYEDTDTEKYHLYLSTWDSTKVAADKEVITLWQGDWDYKAYMFDEVKDEKVNMGYANWYSIPLKSVPEYPGGGGEAKGYGFLIQIGKEVTAADSTVKHTALESNKGLITVSPYDGDGTKKLYDALVDLKVGGSIAIKGGTSFASIQAAEAKTKEQLQELVDAAEKLKETSYKEGWAAFQTALAAAKTTLGKADATAEEYTTAYDNLQKAMDALVPLGTTTTLYYYIGETEDEIGLYHWDDSTGAMNLFSTAEPAEWELWNAGDTYLMTEVAGYAGWYSIPITFQNEGADAGFAIYTKTAGTAAEEAQKIPLFKCDAGEKNNPAVYGQLTSGEKEMLAVKKGVSYAGAEKTAQIMRNVTLYVYDAVDAPYLHMGDAVATALSVVDEATGEVTALEAVSVQNKNAYAMTADAEHKNWYSITFSAPGKLVFDGTEKICGLYTKESKDSASPAWKINLMNGEVAAGRTEWDLDFTPVFAGNIYYKEGVFYQTPEDADAAGKITLAQLQKLVDDAKKLKQEDYRKGWEAFQTALSAAEAVLKKAADAKNDEAITAPTNEEIEKAYADLEAAMKKLVPASAQDAEVNVTQIPLADDFITGADLSSYLSLKESGTVFKDEKGNPLSDADFFRYLRDGGTNWVRIRVWNNPYDSSGRGYGGGNNDLEKAKTIGKLATDAGMKVLIDFHYSDFWADPAKQQAPKAWKAYSLDEKVAAVESYTLESLNALKAAGVNVGMVQIGNETNNAICGESSREKMAKIFNAGSKAVRAFDPACLVALHFTNPEKGSYYKGWAADLQKYGVDYDVFASSYYPFWHGTTGNLQDVLTEVAEGYGKKVMVAETSWTTSWEDGDGHENTAPRTSQALNYEISLQGQANEVHAVIEAVNNVNTTQPGKAIGVFYWEPAWISPYYVYDEDGNADEKLFKQNQEAWEKYGSGWAASYASEYDPDDAGKWYGGSAVDNQSWFDFDGTALATAKIYSLIRTGAVAERAISSIGFAKESNPLEVPLGGTVTYPQAIANYNDGTSEQLDVQWKEEEQEAVNTNKAGEYVVHGTVTQDGKEYKLTLTVKVVRAASANILKNPGMEAGLSQTDWKVSGAAGCISTQEKDWKENPRTGTYAMNFWSQDPAEFTVAQTVTPEAGIYTFGGYIQGDGAGTEDVQYAFVEVTDADGTSRKQAAFTLNGWRNWVNPEITGVEVKAGDSVTVGVTIKATETGTSGVWGSLDDFYLYGTHDVSVAGDIGHGSVETSVIRATSGEKVVVTVTPDEGYYLETMTLSGASITNENYAGILTSENGTVAFRAASGEGTTNAAVLTYAAETAEAKSDTFTMPNGNVEVSATFKSVFGEGEAKVDLKAKDPVTGKYLVQVNIGESESPDGETPIPAQFHTGKDVKPEIALTYKGYQLTAADYTVAYANNKNMTTPESKAKITLTARGEKFEGTREIEFEIKEDTRKEFSAKKLKVVFEASDQNGRTDKAAKAIYYLGKEKKIEPRISLYRTEDDSNDPSKAIDSTLYKAYYQNNKKIGKATLVVLPTDKALKDPSGFKEGSITANFTIAKCPVNQNNLVVTISDAPNYYTGKKVEPALTVTYHYTQQDGTQKTVKLAKGTDYTLTCTNNINASVYKTTGADGTVSYVNLNNNKVPTVKITGKGNFTGTRTTADLGANNKPGTQKFTFQIRPKDLGSLGENAVTAADLAESTKAQAPKITVKDGAKTVAASQYEITKIVRTHGADGTALAASETVYSKADGTGSAKVTLAGTYKATIAGKARANYDGEAEASFRVADKNQLIPNAKITVNGKFYYTGSPIVLRTVSAQQGGKPELQVSLGTGENPIVLSEKTKGSNEDGYYVNYTNNTNAGRATITITGTGQYIGTKTAVFTINKRMLASASTVKDNEKNKKGVLQIPKLSAKKAADQQDGTWTPSTEPTGLINLDNTTGTEYGTLAIPYTGYALNPEFVFSSINGNAAGGEVTNQLSGSDYTVTYAIGKWSNNAAPVTATIKGKGNYSGSVKLQNLFTVTARDLRKFSIDVSSVTYSGKALKPAVTFRDKTTGKTVELKLGTAYTVTYRDNVNIMAVSTKQPKLTVKVKGKGWITDNADDTTKSRTLNFTIDQAEITKADVADVVFQTFMGKALKPKVTVKVNGRKLKEGKDYELTYDKNAKRSGSSTATVSIKGKGNYFTRKPIVKEFIIK